MADSLGALGVIDRARTTLRRVPPLSWATAAVIVLPFVVALVALATQRYAPVLDLAMTEVRVRDVLGRHSPLIGLPGRIGVFPDQGSHPGPLSFYLLAPVYWITGRSAFGLLAGAAVLNATSALVTVWVVGRRGGPRLRLAAAALVMVLSAWLGMSVLTQPWNPYMPVMPFLLAMVCTWAVLDGDRGVLVPLVFAATLCAQTHVPYLTLGVVLVGVGFVAASRHAHRDRCAGVARTAAWRHVGSALATGAVLCVPVAVDQWRHDPGNITMLRRHFLDPPEAPVGVSTGVRVVLSRLDPWQIGSGLAGRGSRWIDTVRDLGGGHWQWGLVVTAVWIAAAAVSSRLSDRRAARLNVVVGAMLLMAVVSTSRIFGKVWYYLVLWVWAIGLLALFAVALTVVLAARERRVGHGHPPVQPRSATRRTLSGGALALALGVAGVAVVDAARTEPPEPRLSATLAALADQTAAALSDRGGAGDAQSGVYLVRFQDAQYFGSQSYGLVSELERRGFDARATTTYRVPMTRQRTIDPTDPAVTAEVVLVTGSYLDSWRQRSDAMEVATFDPRTPAEVAFFAQLRGEAIARLDEEGLGDLVPVLDTNLFGVSLDPRLPADVEHRLSEMLVLGVESAVFLAAPGTVDS